MLDNPNLSLEKMLDVIALGLDFIGYSLLLVVVLLIYLYRYEIRIILKNGFSGDSIGGRFLKPLGITKNDFSKLEKEELNNRVEELLSKRNKTSVDIDDDILIFEDDSLSSKSNLAPPQFRLLRAIRKLDVIMYHFVNEGGAIHDFSVKNNDEIKIFFNFENRIEPEASGYIKILLPKEFKGNGFNFTLIYYDEDNFLHQINYSYSILENKLCSTDR